MEPFVSLKNVQKIYRMGEVEIRAVDGMDFDIWKGEFVVIVGPSGAGKTTVLNILGGMDTCTSGSVRVDGREISGLKERQLTAYRRDDIGFVFQFYNLIQNLTALENVELALQICREPLDAAQVLEDVGLAGRKDNFPAQLSGGEHQTGKAILRLLQETCREKGMTVIVITHNQAITPMADRVIHIKNGKAVQMETHAHPVCADEIEW